MTQSVLNYLELDKAMKCVKQFIKACLTLRVSWCVLLVAYNLKSINKIDFNIKIIVTF